MPPTTSTTAAVTTTAAETTTTVPATTTTLAPPPPTVVGISGADLQPVGGVSFGYLAAAAADLGAHNLASSITVWRDHKRVFGAASGLTVGGAPLTTDTPLVLASVSKLITALTIARLAAQHRVNLDAPVPWDAMHIAHDPGWNNVTPRELLAHTSGMPVNLQSWLKLPGSCAIPLVAAMATPPTPKRGTWVYSNGNYCALGLLVEHVAGIDRDDAAKRLVFDPAHITGPHLTEDGLHVTDGPYAEGVNRLDRLGGAGTWMASTDDITAMMDAVTPADRTTLKPPGVFSDQYGWGHTGTLDGAKACAWVIEGGRTVITAIVSGDAPPSGGGLCDEVLPALGLDLGLWAGKPVRTPD